MSASWIKGAITRATTANDEAPRVVSLHNEDEPPPALIPTWRSIMDRKKRIEELGRQRDQAEQHVSRLTREIAAEEGKKLEDQGRWVMMTRALDIEITETEGGE